jgi:hypothetical protein
MRHRDGEARDAALGDCSSRCGAGRKPFGLNADVVADGAQHFQRRLDTAGGLDGFQILHNHRMTGSDQVCVGAGFP